MDDQTGLLLNEVVKNAEMGKNTVTQLLGITDDERLKLSLIHILPIVAVFICFQKYFTQGITMGAVKG